MVSVNAALQVDLFGQANASRISNRIYSGFGGQTDFVVGALHSKGGQALIALRSWHPKADVSTIVPLIDEPVTSFQHSAVVTENGVARDLGLLAGGAGAAPDRPCGPPGRARRAVRGSGGAVAGAPGLRLTSVAAGRAPISESSHCMTSAADQPSGNISSSAWTASRSCPRVSSGGSTVPSCADLRHARGRHEPVAQALASLGVLDVAALAHVGVDRLGRDSAGRSCRRRAGTACAGSRGRRCARGRRTPSGSATVPAICTTLNGKPVGLASGSVRTSAVPASSDTRAARCAAARCSPDSWQSAKTVPIWTPCAPPARAATHVLRARPGRRRARTAGRPCRACRGRRRRAGRRSARRPRRAPCVAAGRCARRRWGLRRRSRRDACSRRVPGTHRGCARR